MSNISQFFSPNKKNSREFITGPATRTWPVPPGVTELEIHVWGGGGNGASCGSAGGGGGYSRAKVNVTPTDSLSITVGSFGESSTVSIPTQSPASPIFGGGGTSGSNSPPAALIVPGGAGGVGVATLSPTQPQNYCFSANGGTGGSRYGAGGCACKSGGGGGSAGSPYGNGKDGGSSTDNGKESTSGASILQSGKASEVPNAQLSVEKDFIPAELAGAQEENTGQYDPGWFNMDNNFAGSGGRGSAGFAYICGPGATYVGAGINACGGGFLAGGGGGQHQTTPTGGAWSAGGGNGGIAGGGGSHFGGSPTACTLGGVGAVIIYY